MSIGLVGRKCGMTRVFGDDGISVPVTVLKIDSNRIAQIKTIDADGYNSIQVVVGEKKSSHVNRAMAGHYASANMTAGRKLCEFRLDGDETIELAIGTELPLAIFAPGQFVDVQGQSIGKGFAGGIKRHHFGMQDATHGNSVSHRVLGSIGMNQTPGRVFKGKKMAGHLGNVKRTVQNLTIHSIDSDRGLILVRGSVPGSKGSDVVLTPAIKKRNKGKS
jgi:large subunit ribosomal protein L3